MGEDNKWDKQKKKTNKQPNKQIKSLLLLLEQILKEYQVPGSLWIVICLHTTTTSTNNSVNQMETVNPSPKALRVARSYRRTTYLL